MDSARERNDSLSLVRKLTLGLLLSLMVSTLAISSAAAAEGWSITSFDASYTVNSNGTVDVVEDIRVDFGALQKHGILRDIPVEYQYDADHMRRIGLQVIGVDNGARPVPYTTTTNGTFRELRIGDPNVLVSGPQRYRISYRLTGVLNPQQSTDELYWNVTGNGWPVGIGQATATVTAPAITKVTCYQGQSGSTAQCTSNFSGDTAHFTMTQPQSAGGGLTVVVAMPKGAVQVSPPDLVKIKSTAEKVRDFIGLGPLQITLAVLLTIAGFAAVLRHWWLDGRDRWLGDVQYLTGDEKERRRPLFAHDTVVVEYTPPEVGRRGRRYRPAELGTLLDERADTLDVSATIVDLAVRGYLRITEIEKTWVFGKVDYKLERLKPNGDELLEYEITLLDGLFKDGGEVLMSELAHEFYITLARVKQQLYEQVVKADHLFPTNPETVRNIHTGAAFVVIALGAGAVVLLGAFLNAGIVGGAVVLSGLLLLALSRSMSRRTGVGRELYRRMLGFRQYMTVAETDRQRFNEQIGLFQEYLPYAMVFGCVDKWAKVFEDLGLQPQLDSWYVSSAVFMPIAFSASLQSFASSMSTAISSTPGASGMSGFGGSGFGGGFSGGGIGGGGGGSW